MEEEIMSEAQEINYEEETVEIESEDIIKEKEIGTMDIEDPFSSVDIGLNTNEETPNEDHDDDILEDDTPQDSETTGNSLDPNSKSNATRLVQLPLSRIKQIIKLDQDVDRVNPEAVFVITKATEMFLESFAKEIYKVTARSKKKTIQMRDITTCIDDVCCMQFLEGVFPSSN